MKLDPVVDQRAAFVNEVSHRIWLRSSMLALTRWKVREGAAAC